MVTGGSEDQSGDSQRTDDSTTVPEDSSQSETDDVESNDEQIESPLSDCQDGPSSSTRSDSIQSNLSSSIEDSAARSSDAGSDADSDTDSDSPSFLDDIPKESSRSEQTDGPSELSDDDSDTPATPADGQVPSGTEQDRSQSIEDMLLEFDEQEGLIRDRSLLDPNHIVEEDRIVGRDEQLKNVTKMLRVALGNNRPPNLFLYGPSGTGKSLITKAVCKNISRICRSRDIRFGTIEVNCQGLDTLGVAVYELVCCAAEEAGVDVTVPKHGVATKEKWDELFRIVNENFDSVVFVLDELDMLVGRRDKQDPAFSRLLYQLSRAGANDELTAHVSVVAISNDTKMMESVGSRALSSFTPEDVHFDDYDANQLQSILRRRRDAFHENALDEDVIPLASAFAAQTHGDARKAIDLMRVAGELAERENADRVREEHVRGAQDKVEKNRVLEVVRGISTQKKLCLYATAAVAAETDDGTARSTTGYRVYQFLTDSIEAEQYHQETYVNKMKEMTTYSLVDFERRSHGPRSGMFLEFQFGERPETILETLREDSRLDMVSPDEVTSVVQAQIRNQT
jgi:cell division control protein 6